MKFCPSLSQSQRVKWSWYNSEQPGNILKQPCSFNCKQNDNDDDIFQDRVIYNNNSNHTANQNIKTYTIHGIAATLSKFGLFGQKQRENLQLPSIIPNNNRSEKILKFHKFKTMFLTPSEIQFLRDPNNSHIIQDKNGILLFKNKFQGNEKYFPKIQVSYKNGQWYALNNGYLHMLRDLERQGKCFKVPVEEIPLKMVPKTVQLGMTVETNCFTNMKCDCCTKLLVNNEDVSFEFSDTTNISSSETCQDSEHELCRITPECLKDSAFLDELGSDIDEASSSYAGSDFSDYDVIDDDEDDGDDSDNEYAFNTPLCDIEPQQTASKIQHNFASLTEVRSLERYLKPSHLSNANAFPFDMYISTYM